MLKSLYTGVSGMRSHQTRMDVVGNNIANVNTTGYKSGRVHFTDMLYQTMRDAVAPGKSYSGLDPVQVGLGVKVGSIGTIFTQGAFESTERTTDFAINGNGFFALATTANSGEKSFYYTRDGNFTINENGDLMHTGTGIKVQGWEVDQRGNVLDVNGDWVDGDGKVFSVNKDPVTGDVIYDAITGEPTGKTPVLLPDGVTQKVVSLDDLGDIQLLTRQIDTTPYGGTGPEPLDLITFSVAKDGIITGLFENPYGPEPIETKMGKVAITSFTNVEGLYKVGENLLQPSMNSGNPMLNFGEPTDATIESGYLEISNVDLTKEFANMIITQRGFQANSRVITTSDTMLEELLSLKR